MPASCSATSFRQSIGAIGLACAGWFCFCICDSLTKWLARDYDVIQILAITAVTGLVLTGGLILYCYGWRGFRTPRWKWYTMRGFSVIGASFFSAKSLSLIPLADFYGIIFLTPMLMTLIAVLFLKERIGIWRWGAIAAGFTGVLVIAGPAFQNQNIGYAFALLAAMFASTNALIIKKIGREPVIALYAFFPFAANSLFFVPLLLLAPGFEAPHQPVDWTLFLAIAPFSFLGLLGYSVAFSQAREISLVAPFHYSQMIWGALLGFLIFHEVPGLSTATGSLIIVASGLMVIWREHLHHSRLEARSKG